MERMLEKNQKQTIRYGVFRIALRGQGTPFYGIKAYKISRYTV